MTCPFLKEARVKYCRTAAVRKLIPLAQAGRAEEKCSSEAYTGCAAYRAAAEAAVEAPQCPFLHESLMQYCGAASVQKFVPYSESLLSRCGNDGFRYCELYLGMAHPGKGGDGDEVATPDWLRYSSNHLWLDITDDGTCHAGIDAFLSRALGTIDRISFLWVQGRHLPTAVVTVAGVDLELVFPKPFLLTRCNLYLRADPGRITAEPYTGGWLFEGRPDPETGAGLIEGDAARVWMEGEHTRMNQYLQYQEGVAADGGVIAPGVARQLEPDRMRALFNEFFSPYASGKTEPWRFPGS
jgi:glycine cleavage system H protein